MRWLKGNTILRVAIAFAFLYPVVAAFITPDAWLGYFPPFLLGLMPHTLLLGLWSVVEIVIAVWILLGKHIFIPSFAAAVLLCLIVLFNLPYMEIVFRDVSLALVALYLARTAQ